jgi:hypothetical protein
MSSSRANAAARQRRAGDTQQTQQTQPQSSYNSSGSKTRFVQQQQEAPQPPMNPKLSISDAIALITLRLGRVENIVSNYDPNAVSSSSGNHQMNYDENMRMVDEQVFNSIVSRLEALEKGRNVGSPGVIEQRLSVLEKNQKMLIEKQQQIPVVGSSTETTIVNDVAEEKLKPMEESIQYVKSELSSLKELLLRLQSFTMDTNQKLADIVFDVEDKSASALNNAFMMSLHNSGFNMNMDGGIRILDSENEHDADIEVQDDGVEMIDEVKDTIQSTNLKELVKQELMSEEEGASAML